MSINKEVTVYTFEDKEYIQEQFEILIRNDESLCQAEDFVFRGAYRQDIKGNLIMQKLVNAYDRHCIYLQSKVLRSTHSVKLKSN